LSCDGASPLFGSRRAGWFALGAGAAALGLHLPALLRSVDLAQHDHAT